MQLPSFLIQRLTEAFSVKKLVLRSLRLSEDVQNCPKLVEVVQKLRDVVERCLTVTRNLSGVVPSMFMSTNCKHCLGLQLPHHPRRGNGNTIDLDGCLLASNVCGHYRRIDDLLIAKAVILRYSSTKDAIRCGEEEEGASPDYYVEKFLERRREEKLWRVSELQTPPIEYFNRIIHGYPWILVDTNAYPWMSMDIHGYPWMSMNIHEYP